MPLNDRKHAKSGGGQAGAKPENRMEAVLRRVRSMKIEEREELFGELLGTYCAYCANELDAEGECPNKECESYDDFEEDDEDDEDEEDDDDDGDDDADADSDDSDPAGESDDDEP